jgi:hypothetical protein
MFRAVAQIAKGFHRVAFMTPPIKPMLLAPPLFLPLNPTRLMSLAYLQNQSMSYFRMKRRKGCLNHKGKSKFNSLKRRSKRKNNFPKLHNHNGLLHRVRIVLIDNVSTLILL